MKNRWPRGTILHVVRHPRDGVALVRAGWALRRRNWWRVAPFIPVPDPDYWKFRLTTAYGNSDVEVDIHDAVAAAHWSRRVRRGR
jgi:hypothetical protein